MSPIYKYLTPETGAVLTNHLMMSCTGKKSPNSSLYMVSLIDQHFGMLIQDSPQESFAKLSHLA